MVRVMNIAKRQPVLLEHQRIASAKYALPLLRNIKGKRQEHFVCIALDSRMEFIAKKTIFIGSLTSTIVHPREVYAYALHKCAVSIIIAHNHPSGEALPSNADIDVTHQLVAAGLIMGIRLQDHIIVSKSEHFSFTDQGMLLEQDLSEQFKRLLA